MLIPFDGWTIGHGLVGFLLGKMKFRRLLFYPIPIGWEIYQLYFHYQPRGYSLDYVCPNSLADIVVCIFTYELALRNLFIFKSHPLWIRLNDNIKMITGYFSFTLGISWLFWDDVLRLGLSSKMPFPRLPLIAGSFSPIIASFIVSKCFGSKEFNIFSLISFKRRTYLTTGLIPTIIILVFLVLAGCFER